MKRLLLAGSFASLLLSCGQNQNLTIEQHEEPLIIGKASPITLQNGSTEITLTDYVLKPERIDSITVDGSLSLETKENSLLLNGDLEKPASLLHFWSGGIAESVLLKKSNKTEHIFSYSGSATDVKIKGEFNAWNPNNTTLEDTGSGYKATVTLNPGQYQYLYVVDGVEVRDPNNPDSVDNGMGGWNSIIRIPRADRGKLPLLSTNSTNANEIIINASNPATAIIAFYNNYMLPSKAVNIEGKAITLTLPESDKETGRSHLRVWAYNNEGLSNEVLVPLEDGKVLADASKLTREDKEAMIMYFLMVDRFNNGNTSNDKPLNIPEVHPKADYQGGDLAGVEQKVADGYFKSLGVNTIWLSPITQNPEGAYGKYPTPETAFSGYHGYWPIRSKVVDYRFGTSEEMHSLVNSAHSSDMNVLLDYVANHVHELHPVYQNNKDWATDLYLPDGSLNTERWDEHRLTTWFDTFMPTLDLSRMEIVDPMTDSALFWLKEYKIDGFRHDATKHIPLIFWRVLTEKVKKQVVKPEDKMIFQIGETYGSRELISSYINTGMLDAQFDFNLYDDAVSTFARDEVSFKRLTNSLRESLSYYGDHNLMGYITGNQDRPRFISYADGSLKFEEDTKLAGWTREIEVQDTTAYHKLSSLTAFMMTIPGIPVIYYGDEIGSPGGNDPDNRRMMRFENLTTQEQATLERARKLTHLRKNNLALIFGDLNILQESDDFLVIERNYFDNHVIAAFNKSNSKKTYSLDSGNDYKTNFRGSVSENTLELPPYSFEIITY
ncbi:alpha-amlyase [Fulvivirga sp. RKSG066]|uniref:alpha-amylase family glycosyl hydrolase n=1 Tax=Fulvivirga aurantia TaxID=2529383 RepID=UPI0012BB7C60|nr:alpha-amylase family glycosyl hydrolase [Fulvivirga aurantia]MTI22291.1 alpha-amlyase [Fulvivirga aurantia]